MRAADVRQTPAARTAFRAGEGRVQFDEAGGHHVLPLFGDERDPVRDPRIGDELVGLSGELAEYGVDGDGYPGDHGGDMRIDQIGELITVVTVEGAHFPHERPPGSPVRHKGGRHAVRYAPRVRPAAVAVDRPRA